MFWRSWYATKGLKAATFVAKHKRLFITTYTTPTMCMIHQYTHTHIHIYIIYTYAICMSALNCNIFSLECDFRQTTPHWVAMRCIIFCVCIFVYAASWRFVLQHFSTSTGSQMLRYTRVCIRLHNYIMRSVRATRTS